MGAYAISGHPSLQGFGGKGTYLDFPNCYRCKFKQQETCNGECYKTLEEQLAAIGIEKSDVGAIEIEAFLCDGGDMPFLQNTCRHLRNSVMKMTLTSL